MTMYQILVAGKADPDPGRSGRRRRWKVPIGGPAATLRWLAGRGKGGTAGG